MVLRFQKVELSDFIWRRNWVGVGFKSCFLGLDGKDDLEHAQMDALIGFFEDFTKEIQSWFTVALGFGQGDKVSKWKKKER